MLTRFLHLSVFLFSLLPAWTQGQTGSLNVLAQDISDKQIQLLDENNEPLIGATIQRYSIITDEFLGGTISDVNGKFSLPDVEDQELVISYLGFKTKQVATKHLGEDTIRLEQNSYEIIEVVVSCYSILRERGCGGYCNHLICTTKGVLIDTTTYIENTTLSNWKYYPNPTIDQVTIESKDPSGEVILYALDGREIFRKEMTNTSETIQLSNYPAGTYILTHHNVGKTDIIGKVIKIRE